MRDLQDFVDRSVFDIGLTVEHSKPANIINLKKS
jgi:hypothetical protein